MKKHTAMTATRFIAIGFLLIIFIGSVLLSLPSAAKSGVRVPYLTAVFTATSATCVTGLSLADTYRTWSRFGQIIILVLIQIGGLGFMSIITMFSVFLHRRIGLRERRLLMESAGTMRISGVVRLIKKIMLGTLIFEGVGAVCLAFRFCPQMGMKDGIFNAVFHAVSAFCNAGFDLMGRDAPFSSLTAYCGDAAVNITVCMLVIIGGLGFIVWDDVLKNKFRFSKYELHSKIVLTVSVLLVVIPTVLFYLYEKNSAFSGLGTGEKWLAAFFQAVSPRTAGFNTVDLGQLSEGGKLLMIILMFIGGSPGSTAGGIKTTTFAVLILGVVSSARHTSGVTVFKRRLDNDTIKRASAIFVIYTVAVIISAGILCANEPYSLYENIFETVSAIGTVGLTTGITSKLKPISDIVLMILMYGGRVGGLTLMLSLAEKKIDTPIKRPVEKIIIG